MKKFIAVLIAILGILLSIYIGIGVMFVGGLVQIFNSIEPLNTVELAIGICKVLFFETAGIFIYIGFAVAGILYID